MKRVILAVVGAAVMALGLIAVPTATAAPTITIQSGMKYGNVPPVPTSRPYGVEDFCTIGAVGYDAAGRKVAITAGHCSNGETTGWTAVTTGGALLGTVETAKTEYMLGVFEEGKFDYGFILLGDNVVFADDPATPPNPKSVAVPVNGERLCKFGHASLFGGERCGNHLGNYNEIDYNVLLASWFGDSGGPVYRANDKTKLVGLISRPYNLNSVVVQRVDTASADASANGWVGGGFMPIA